MPVPDFQTVNPAAIDAYDMLLAQAEDRGLTAVQLVKAVRRERVEAILAEAFRRHNASISDRHDDLYNPPSILSLAPRTFFDLVESELRAEAASELPPADSIPQQLATASRFSRSADGLIDLAPDPVQVDELQREMYDEVRHKAGALAALGDNQLADLSDLRRGPGGIT
jgi:hypothetical protein